MVDKHKKINQKLNEVGKIIKKDWDLSFYEYRLNPENELFYTVVLEFIPKGLNREDRFKHRYGISCDLIDMFDSKYLAETIMRSVFYELNNNHEKSMTIERIKNG